MEHLARCSKLEQMEAVGKDEVLLEVLELQLAVEVDDEHVVIIRKEVACAFEVVEHQEEEEDRHRAEAVEEYGP